MNQDMKSSYMEDPQTWHVSTTVKCADTAWDWLVTHLKGFDRLFFTSRGEKATYGFQPFMFNQNKFIKGNWVRDFPGKAPSIKRHAKLFDNGVNKKQEFITWVVPDSGVVTIHLTGNVPKHLNWLSNETMVLADKEPTTVIEKYLADIESCDSKDEVLMVMCNFTISV